ncbi:MAG: hypothetical protein IJ196_07880 [Prevotella sp.]|nr:hypothetical protein [Prevotella sp.]
MKNNNITNDDIILMAKQLKDEQNAGMKAPCPFPADEVFSGSSAKVPADSPLLSAGKMGLFLAAASLIGFLFGIGMRPSAPSVESALANATAVEHTDTVIRYETIRDTIYQTQYVTVAPASAKELGTLTARNDVASPTGEQTGDDGDAESYGCSVVCDEIPYDLLAAY